MAHWKVPAFLGLPDPSVAAPNRDEISLGSPSSPGSPHETLNVGHRTDLTLVLPFEVLSLISSYLCYYDRSNGRGIISSDFFKLRLVCRAWDQIFLAQFLAWTSGKKYKHYTRIILPPRSPATIDDLYDIFSRADPVLRSSVSEVMWRFLPAWNFRSQGGLASYLRRCLLDDQTTSPTSESIETTADVISHLFDEFQLEQDQLITATPRADITTTCPQNAVQRICSLLPHASFSTQCFDFWTSVGQEVHKLRKRAGSGMLWVPPISKDLRLTDEFSDLIPYRFPSACLQTLSSLSTGGITSLSLRGVETDFLDPKRTRIESRAFMSDSFADFMSHLKYLDLSIARRDIVVRKWMYRCAWVRADGLAHKDMTDAGRFNTFLSFAKSVEHLTITLEQNDYLGNVNLPWHEWLGKTLDDQHWPALMSFKTCGFGITDYCLLPLFARHSNTLKEVVLEDFASKLPLDALEKVSADDTDEELGEIIYSSAWISRLLAGMRDDLNLDQAIIRPRYNALHLIKASDERLSRLGKELSVEMSRYAIAKHRRAIYFKGVSDWILKRWTCSDSRLAEYEELASKKKA
jgi:hypothetical protein